MIVLFIIINCITNIENRQSHPCIVLIKYHVQCSCTFKIRLQVHSHRIPRTMSILFNTTYEDKVWYGPKVPPIYGPNVSLGQVLITCMARSRKRKAQICHDTGVSWTNEELHQLTIRCALNLLDLGLKEGDVIGVATKNEMILTPIVVAALLLGLPINPVNFSYKRGDILHMFSITEPKVVICCPENFQVIQSVIQEIGSNALVYIIGDRVEGNDQRSADELLKLHSAEELFV